MSPNTIRKLTARVDVQVSTMVFFCTVFATILTSIVYWNFTFKIMLVSLEERVYALYDSVEERLDMDTFYLINNEDDVQTQLYKDSLQELLNLKKGSGVMYLYTAKENENGEFIYLIDGLEEDEDFRYPGSLIEADIVPKMKRALDGETIMPKKIINADWGDIFISYLPVHDENNDIVGVVGIEFDASVTYKTYKNLISLTPFIIILVSLTAMLISIRAFKRISNPLYMDLATKDSPTGLKNRNAYDVDLNNLIVRGKMEDIGIVVADINGLKEINDRLGHSAGDDYIRLVAQAIKDNKKENMVAYRVGGDEFVLISTQLKEIEIKEFIEQCSNQVENQKLYTDMRCAVSCGYGVFDCNIDENLEDTYKRADILMYEEKRRYKQERNKQKV